MNIYFVSRHSDVKGPFEIKDNHREQIIKVGDVCLRDTNEGVVFLFISGNNNTWDSCLSVGIGDNSNLTEVNNTLVFSFDGLHQRKGDLSLIKTLIPCFREKIIFEFFRNAIDILEFKKDSWTINFIQQFLSPTKEKISLQEIEEFTATPKPDNKTSGAARKVVGEVETGMEAPYLHDPTKNKEINKLFERYYKGDKKAYELLVKENIKLVASIAHSYKDRGLEYNDLVQEGMIGLIRAIERFDTRRNVPFFLYAKWWIHQSIILSLQTLPFPVKLPLNQISLYNKVQKRIEEYEKEHGYEPSITDLDIDDEEDIDNIAYLRSLPDNLLKLTSRMDDWEDFQSDDFPPDEELLKESKIIFVNDILGRLRKTEAYIIRSYYGIGVKSDTFATIGDRIGLSRERVRQILEKALKKMRVLLKVKKNNNKDSEEEALSDNNEIVVKSSEKEEKKQKVHVKKEHKQRESKNDKKIILSSYSVYRYKQYKILNKDSISEIRDFNNLLVYSCPGKIKPLEGSLYSVTMFPSFLVINYLENSGLRFKKSYEVIWANSNSSLYKSLNKYNYIDEILSIRRDFVKREYQVKVGENWYNKSGHLVTDEPILTPEPKKEPEPKIEKHSDSKDFYEIIYDSKKCTVLEKKDGRLVVRYEDGKIDNLKDDSARYKIVSKKEPQIVSVEEEPVIEPKEEPIIELEDEPVIEPEDLPEETKQEDHEEHQYIIDDSEIEHVYLDNINSEPYSEVMIETHKEEKEVDLVIDTKKIEHIFDNKSTSYKYFWFMSFLSLSKENGYQEILFKDIVIRMAALAWPIILSDRVRLGKQDMIESCLYKIKRQTYLFDDISSGIVEAYLRDNYKNKGIDKILDPLLTNVPYRFLSPWIKYTSDSDVIKKSKDQTNQTPYALHDDHIVINKEWQGYFKDHYDELSKFALQSFISYAKRYNNDMKLLKLLTLGWSI